MGYVIRLTIKATGTMREDVCLNGDMARWDFDNHVGRIGRQTSGYSRVELIETGGRDWTVLDVFPTPESSDLTEDEEILVKALRARFDYSRLARLAANIEHATGEMRISSPRAEDQIDDLDTLTKLLEAAAGQ